MTYLNFHTHQSGSNALVNVLAGIEPVPASGWFSIGMHPMFLTSEADFEQLVPAAATQNSCLLIGECGLDKRSKAPIADQIRIFKQHIALANELQKPLLIHCVKAHQELLHIRAITTSAVPWIVHGFNQQLTIGKQLIEAGFFFSLGKALLHPTSNASLVLKEIPLSRLFLETDDAALSIEEVYHATSNLLQLPVQVLASILHKNFRRTTGQLP